LSAIAPREHLPPSSIYLEGVPVSPIGEKLSDSAAGSRSTDEIIKKPQRRGFLFGRAAALMLEKNGSRSVLIGVLPAGDDSTAGLRCAMVTAVNVARSRHMQHPANFQRFFTNRGFISPSRSLLLAPRSVLNKRKRRQRRK